MKIRFPRTRLGWLRLILITFRRCPRCKSGLIKDDFQPWDDTLYCMPCGGAMYPNGFWKSLASNYIAEKNLENKNQDES